MSSLAPAVRTVKEPVIPPRGDDDRIVGVVTVTPRFRIRSIPPRSPLPTDRDPLMAILLAQNYSSVYRDDIVRRVAAADDPTDAMLDLVAEGSLEFDDLAGARRAYGID